MANQKPLQRLHVMMLKPSVSKIDEALRTTKGLQRFEIAGGMNFSGALFLSRALPKPRHLGFSSFRRVSLETSEYSRIGQIRRCFS
jgi:hypothetical protein